MSVVCENKGVDDGEALDHDEQDRKPSSVEKQPGEVQEVVLNVLDKDGVGDPQRHSEEGDKCHTVAQLRQVRRQNVVLLVAEGNSAVGVNEPDKS